MSSNILRRLDKILEYVISYHVGKGNTKKVVEYMIYKKNLRHLSIVGVTTLLKELKAEVDELAIDVPEQVIFT